MKKIKIGLGILIIISILTFSGIATARTNTPEVRGKEKIVFIHYKKDFAKPSSARPAKAPACYGFLSKGAKLKTVEDFTKAKGWENVQKLDKLVLSSRSALPQDTQVVII